MDHGVDLVESGSRVMLEQELLLALDPELALLSHILGLLLLDQPLLDLLVRLWQLTFILRWAGMGLLFLRQTLLEWFYIYHLARWYFVSFLSLFF